MDSKVVSLPLMPRFISISSTAELLRIPSEILMYITAEGNYCKVHIKDGKSHLVSFQLGQLEDSLAEQLGEELSPFIRIGKSLIVNKDYVYLIDTSKLILILSDWNGKYYELNASRKALTELKLILEHSLT